MNTPLGPSVPFVNMEIGATDRGDFDSYKNLVATVSWNCNFAELRIGNRRVAVDANCEIPRLYFHDDDLALNVAQTRQRLVLAFDMPVIAGVQVIRCKMFPL